MNYFFIFLMGGTFFSLIIIKIGIHIVKLVFVEKDKTVAFQVQAESNKLGMEIYKEVAGAFGGLHERLFIKIIENNPTYSPLPYPLPSPTNVLQNPLPRTYGLTDGRTDAVVEEMQAALQMAENKPIEWKIPKELSALGKISESPTNVYLFEETPEGIVKHSAKVPSKESGLIPFAKGYYVGCCQNPACYNRFFSTEKHAKYCEESCRKQTHNFKLKK